jgi:hypothetical protein
MRDRPATADSDPALDDDALLDDDRWEPALDEDGPPARRRRRLVTPLTAGLCGVLLALAGFVAGVQVQKGQEDGGGASSGAPAGAGAAGFGGFGGARGGAGGGGGAAGGEQGQQAPTVGSVANKKGSTLYVTNADGSTVRVKTNAQSKVTRTAAASPRGIYPGDTVVVQGTKSKDGSIVATQITATSKSAAASGGGFPGGGGLRQRFAAPPG